MRKCDDDEELEDLDQYEDEEAVQCLFMGLANQMLSNAQGQQALGIIWEFLKQNMDWVTEALGLPPILPPLPDPPTPVPPAKLTFTPEPLIYSPLHNYNKILFTTYHQVSFKNLFYKT